MGTLGGAILGITDKKVWHRAHIALPCIDSVLVDLRERFTQPHQRAIAGAAFLVPDTYIERSRLVDHSHHEEYLQSCIQEDLNGGKVFDALGDEFCEDNFRFEIGDWFRSVKQVYIDQNTPTMETQTQKQCRVSIPSTIQETLLCPLLIQAEKRAFFPLIDKLLRKVATLPLTTCTCERSISMLRRVKTYLRATMLQQRR